MTPAVVEHARAGGGWLAAKTWEGDYYGLIECAGSEHALWRFGRAVVARPSILWWFAHFPAVFAANRVNRNSIG